MLAHFNNCIAYLSGECVLLLPCSAQHWQEMDGHWVFMLDDLDGECKKKKGRRKCIYNLSGRQSVREEESVST